MPRVGFPIHGVAVRECDAKGPPGASGFGGSICHTPPSLRPNMFKKSFLILGASLVAGISCHAATLTLGSRTYAVTTGTYSGYSNWDTAIQAEFGSGSSTAEFTTLKLDAVGNEQALWNFLISEGLGSAYIEYNGSATYGGMPVFLEMHASYPGPGWFVINNIDSPPTGYPNRMDLGRWDLGNQKILAVVTPIPEPSAFLMLGAGAVALTSRRRR